MSAKCVLGKEYSQKHAVAEASLDDVRMAQRKNVLIGERYGRTGSTSFLGKKKKKWKRT